MLTLYDFGNSVCCQKVRITMRAKELDWESVKVDLFKAEQYDPKYLKLNPKGIVPTLMHDGKVIIESTLICEYLDDTFPEPRLIPATATSKRGRQFPPDRKEIARRRRRRQRRMRAARPRNRSSARRGERQTWSRR
jgi:glutathione S-transferase